jgi:hypothetical protein
MAFEQMQEISEVGYAYAREAVGAWAERPGGGGQGIGNRE